MQEVFADVQELTLVRSSWKGDTSRDGLDEAGRTFVSMPWRVEWVGFLQIIFA